MINEQSKTSRQNLKIDLTHSDLSEKEKTSLNKFLNENKQVFATNLKELGLTDKHYHRIETDDNAPAVKMPFYRQPPHLKKKMDRSQNCLKTKLLFLQLRPGSHQYYF